MDKRKFIYYNIHNIENNKRIILNNYIELNGIEHSVNSNGLLLNLSLLDQKHIDYIYNLYNLENKYPQYDTVEAETSDNKKSKKINITYKNYQLSSLEQLILSYSTN
jgi:hypothetical protein